MADDAPIVLKTIDPLVCECAGGSIVVSSPHLPRRLRVTQAVASLLLAARSGLDPRGAPAETVDRLVAAGFLVKSEEAGPAESEPWRDWGVTAWSFHQRTREVRFVGADPGQISAYRDRITARPRPHSVRTPVSGQVLLLPRIRSRLEVPFREVLEGRRTHRHFLDREVPLDAFSDLLHYCFAPLRFADAGAMGVLQLRASASGGARHETEAFVFVFNVSGVAPGLYHYDNIRHGLEPLGGDGGRDQLEHLTHDQGFFLRAGFGVLTVAVADRMSWKYPHPAAYRMLLHNVGHVAQVFSMTAAALGLGAAITGAIRGGEADRALGLDRPREFVTFALACGHPQRAANGLPAAIRVPAVAPEYY